MADVIKLAVQENGQEIPLGTEQARVIEAVSPTVDLERVSDGVVMTVHDLHGDHVATINDGEKGETGERGPQGIQGEQGPQGERGLTGETGPAGPQGVPGQDGQPGRDGQDGAPGKDGQDGKDGVSPTITVTDIHGGHRVTITDATGAHSFDVMDGESGSGAVLDVQVNGTSVLDAQGVANVPVVSAQDRLGLVKVNTSYGLNVYQSGLLRIWGATSADIKGEANQAKPIVPDRQHESAFYGLAKAAGSDEKNSALPVGQYTESAKSAIQTMLGLSAIIGTIEGATASKQYSVGQPFLHGGALYKATAVIAANDAIVPGTNCEQTTIIDLIMGV